MKVEEHVTILQEPGGQYIGHVTSVSGSAHNIFTAITKFFTENDIQISSLKAT